MVAAVVLAAGAGRRMGNRPKALLDLDGETFLERVVRTCRAGGVQDIWVVTRPGISELLDLAEALDVNAVLNPDPERGMFSSVQCGIRAALAGIPEFSAILIFPVDHPRVAPATVAAVLTAVRARGARACVQPAHDGRPGHPIAIDRPTAEALLPAPPTSTLREVLRDLKVERRLLPVNDPGIAANVNTPDPPR